ncbi:MAG: hypothetical protein AAF716_02965 [Cyanobacteria bacterium P01_D01_bin.1]
MATQTNTLNEVLETALELPEEQQKMLIDILQRRYAEKRREEIARDAQRTLDDFRSGHLKAQPIEDIIAELNQSVDDFG